LKIKILQGETANQESKQAEWNDPELSCPFVDSTYSGFPPYKQEIFFESLWGTKVEDKSGILKSLGPELVATVGPAEGSIRIERLAMPQPQGDSMDWKAPHEFSPKRHRDMRS
jgi:hypothetical protein